MIEGQNGNQFVRSYLQVHLDRCDGKTLGELDVAHAFDKAIGKRKVTGIAGDVVEKSVLSLRSNPKQEPDIVVDGVKYEVKTTGVRKPRKSGDGWEAKEPMSITAVSPETITGEDYSISAFWHKVEHLLLFYYHYDSKKVVSAAEYAAFPLLGHQFHEYEDFTIEEREMLENDWLRVRNFIHYLQENYSSYEDEYPRISHDLRKTLFLLDTAPKWPNRPRFRFKRTFVSSIVQRFFAKQKLVRKLKLESLPGKIVDYKDLDEKCFQIQKQYGGKTVGDLCDTFSIDVPKQLKSIAEPVIVRMFGGSSKSMRKVELFRKLGVWGKSFVITQDGGRTEDAKFFTIDFDEFFDDRIEFEDSQFYEFFSSTRILLAVFKEPSPEAPLIDNQFVRFETLVFDDSFIYKNVRPVWNRIRELIRTNQLVDVPVIDKTGKQRRNKNGELSSAPNFPKSSEGVVFVRGTGTDSKDKRECVNGVRMYYQQVWLKGSYIAELIQETVIF